MMGRWLERLKNEKGASEEPTKPTKPQKNTLNVGSVSFVSTHNGPFQKIEKILLSTQFTKEMIDEGLKLWKQPFDSFDLDEIRNGQISQQQVIDYLALWIEQHPEQYLILCDLLEPEREADIEGFTG